MANKTSNMFNTVRITSGTGRDLCHLHPVFRFAENYRN